MDKEEFKDTYVFRYMIDERRLNLVVDLLDNEPGNHLFRAPASTSNNYHHSYDGGLIVHITSMTDIAIKTRTSMLEVPHIQSGLLRSDSPTEENDGFPSEESIFLVCLLHDLHKACDFVGRPYYTENMLKSGRSEKKPYKINKDSFSFNEDIVVLNNRPRSTHFFLEHAELNPSGLLSLQVLSQYSPNLLDLLSTQEKNAIIYHAGAYETSRSKLSGKEDWLQIIIHFADMIDSRYERPRNV